MAHPFTQLAFSTLTPFSRLLHHPRHQIQPSSEREERRTGKYTHFHLNIHQQQPHKKTRDEKRKQKQKHRKKTERSANISPRKQTETRHKVENTLTHRHTLAHARTHVFPDTQLPLTDKHTKKQQTQSPAQPEVYFMQKYSKVCFTIQLNIKGGYIPL